MRLLNDKVKNNVLRNKFFLNPFYIFSFIWTIIVLLYSLNILTIYPRMPAKLLLFFVSIILMSLIFGYIYKKRYLSKSHIVCSINDKPLRMLFFVCLIGFVIEIIYTGSIPLITVLKGDTSTYASFGITSFTFVVVSATIGLEALSSIKWIYGKKHKKENFLISMFPILRFILVYSRGLLILCLAIIALPFLAKIKITFTKVVAFLIVLVIGALGFNAFGNLRVGSSWSDSSYIMNITNFNDEYSCLSPFSWVLTYVLSPTGNLAYNVSNNLATYDMRGVLSQLLPDVLSKRLFSGYTSDIPLPQPGLTVSTMFSGSYKYMGFLGMYLSFFELVLLIFIFTELSKRNDVSFVAIMSSLSIITALCFFDNMIHYSGYSFFLFFIIGYSFFSKKPNRRYIAAKKKYFN